MAKCIGCNKEKGARHAAACQTRPGRLTVREQDCKVPEEMQKGLARDAISCAVYHASRDAAQEKVHELLGPIMHEAEQRYHAKRGLKPTDAGTDLFKDIDKVHTADEEAYVDLVLERCAGWLEDDMPKTFEELEAFNRRSFDVHVLQQSPQAAPN